MLSYAEFEGAVKPNLAPAIIRHALPHQDGFVIPDWTQLEPGDVVLSTSSRLVGWGQKALGVKPDAAQWTHAMLYTGHLHVAEAQTFFLTDGSVFVRSGTRLWPLTAYAGRTNLLVCRLKDEVASPKVREKIAHHASEDLAAANRHYDFKRTIFESWFYPGLAKVLPARFWKAKTPPAGMLNATQCSEYVLECMANGGGVMVEEFGSVLTKELYFYPASFAESDKFVTHPLDLRVVSHKPPPRKLA